MDGATHGKGLGVDGGRGLGLRCGAGVGGCGLRRCAMRADDGRGGLRGVRRRGGRGLLLLRRREGHLRRGERLRWAGGGREGEKAGGWEANGFQGDRWLSLRREL